MIYLGDWFSQQISNVSITAAIRFHKNVIAFPKFGLSLSEYLKSLNMGPTKEVLVIRAYLFSSANYKQINVHSIVTLPTDA